MFPELENVGISMINKILRNVRISKHFRSSKNERELERERESEEEESYVPGFTT